MNELHPDREQLRAYAIGQLNDDEATELEHHLVTCPECEETLDDLSVANATLIDGLRHPRPADPVLHEPRLTLALARIAALADAPRPTEPQPSMDEPDTDLGSIGMYRLLAELGVGGMGKVYKALHSKLKRVVALKVLPTERLRNPQAISRFEREMEAVGRLEHPHIVRAFDAGEADGAHFLVMEFVDGWDLSTVSRQRGPLAVADACELIRQAAMGLQFAHERGLVHRDIKPGNLMLHVPDTFAAESSSHPENAGPTVKILDFGLARLSDLQDEADGLTSTGQIMGTLEYMAPEQADDSHGIDIRGDIYSLGATLYKLLTGHSIYHGERVQTTIQKLSALVNHPVPPIQSRRDDISDDLAAVVHRLLEKDPARRFATPLEVAAALEPFAAGADLTSLARRMRGDEAMPVVDPSTQTTHDSIKSASVDSAPDVPRREPAALSATTVHLSPAQAASPSVDTQSQRQRPPGRNLVIGLAAAAAILLAAVVFYFQTDHGTLVVELDDSEGELSVAVEGQAVVISDKQKPAEAIRLRAGEHKLHVTRGDLKFDSDAFTIRRGDRVALNVKLVAGEIQVVRKDAVPGDKPLGRASLPKSDSVRSPTDPMPVSPPHVAAGAASSEPATDAGPSPWDGLDPMAIPEAERIPQLPPKTVAVFGSHRQRHWSGALSFAIRPDGKQAATAGGYGIRFWNLDTFQETAWLNPRDHNVRGVGSLAYTADGQRLIAGHSERFILLIDCTTETPNVISRLPLTGDVNSSVGSLELSPSGEWLMGAGVQQGYLWRMTDDALVPGARFPDLARNVYDKSPIVFSPDGQRICVSSREDGTVQLYEFDAGEVTAGPLISGSSEDRDDAPVAPLRQARFAPDGRLAIADGKDRLWFWDVSGDEPQPLFRLDRPAVVCRFSSDGKTLLTHRDSDTTAFNVWTLGPDDATFRFSNHPTSPGSFAIRYDNLRPIALSGDGKVAITGHWNGAVRFWNLAGDTLREHEPIAPNPISPMYSIKYVVRLQSGIAVQTEGPESICIRPAGTALTSTMLTDVSAHQYRRPLGVSSDQSRLVTEAPGGMVIIHKPSNAVWQPIRGVTTGAAGSMYSAALNADHSRLVTGTGNAISLWDLTTPQLTRVAQFDIDAEPQQLNFAADEKLLVARIGHRVSVFRVNNESLEELPVPDLNSITQLNDFDISPDGLELATAANGRIDRWSLSESAVQHVQRLSGTNSVSYSPDGRRLARMTGTNLVIRNLQTDLDEQAIPFPGPVGKVIYLDDSRHIATANRNGTLYILRP